MSPRMPFLTYDRVVTLHGQSIVLDSTRTNHIELPVAGRGSEVCHILNGRTGQSPGVAVGVVVFDLDASGCCT